MGKRSFSSFLRNFSLRKRRKRSSTSTDVEANVSLPEDIIFEIITHVPRCNYPTLSRVSKHFKSLVSSPQLSVRRTLLGYRDPCLYVVLYDFNTQEHRLLVHRKANDGSSFVLIKSLPPLPSSGAFVTVGSKIYVLDENGSFAIDCTSHTIHPLPSWPKLTVKVADVIDKKIYVMGYSIDDNSMKNDVMVVFNTETQMFEPDITKLYMFSLHPRYYSSNVVIGGKMYVRIPNCNSFVFEPKETRFEKDEILNSWDWKNACVIENVLYYYDRRKYKLRWYDPKCKRWGVVKGVGKYMPKISSWSHSHTMNLGGKLGVFFSTHIGGDQIWYLEIALERRQGGLIWGKLEWLSLVVDGYYDITQPLVVMV